MALTGRLVADFSSFSDAVQRADVQLRTLDSGAGKVSSSLNKMADSLSGRKLVQDAELMAEAVERVGGASKLTEDELQKVAAKAAAAVEKLTALGIDVPPGIAKIAAETKQAGTALESMKTIALDVAGAFGIAFSVGAIVNFGKEIFALADNIVKLSDKTGLTVEEVQRLSYVADQSGNNVEQLTDAVSKLQVNLSNPKAQDAISKLNVNFQQLKAASPYQQLQLIADAMSKIESPSKQAEYAVALFGKTGTEILPTLKAKFSEVANQVTVASEQEVRAMDAAGDAISRLSTTVKAKTVDIIGSFILAGEQAQNIGLLKVLAAFVANGAPATVAALAAVGGAAKSAGKDINLPLETDPLIEYRKHLDETRESVGNLSEAQKQAITDGLKLGDSQSDIASALVLSTQAVAAFVKAQEEATENRIFVEKLAQQWHDLYVDMRLTGLRNINEYAKAVQDAMAKQREAVQASQLQLLGLITSQRTELANLNGTALTGVDAAMAALDKKYTADIAHIEQLGRAATEAGVGGAAWSQQAQEAADNAYKIYVEQFNRIVSDSNKTFGEDVPAALNSGELKSAAGQGASGIAGPFTAAFQSVESAADAMAAHVASVLGAVQQTDAYRNSGFFVNPGFGTADTINRTALSHIGLTVPGFANGVQNYAGGMALVGERGPELVNLPGGSSVTPNGSWGGTTVSIGSIVVNGAGGAQAGRDAADALLARLKAKGVRV